MRILTGNDLKNGRVVWWDGQGWSIHVEDAADVGDQAESILAREDAACRVNGGYAIDLTVLKTTCGSVGQGFLPPDMTGAATVLKSGYNVTLATSGVAVAGPADCNGTATELDFESTAGPASPGSTGNRYFGVTAAGTVFQNSTAAPTFADMAAGGTATTTPIQ
jgi:hypothetical protein